MPTFGSLFAGIGGFDLGFERAGFEPLWQVEANKQCLSVLARHWPEVERCDDVRSVTAEFVRPDWIVGGFPCQDLSVAGRRAGLAGERSGLFHEFMRIVGELSPSGVVIENVPGLLSSNGGRDMGIVLGALAKLGYGFAYRVLDAQWFGVAQRRKRVFIVGCLGNWRRAAEILFEPESMPWDSPPSREAGTRVAACLSPGAHPGSHNGQDDHKDGRLIAFDTTQITSPANRSVPKADDPCHPLASGAHAPAIAHTLRGEGFDASEDGTGRGTPLVTGFIANDYKNHTFKQSDHSRPLTGSPDCSRSAPIVVHAIQERAVSENETSGPQGKGYQSDIGYTLEARHHQQAVTAPNAVRRLLPVECERLQGFPDEHTRWGHDGTEISDSARYRMLGNAVAVPNSEWIANRIPSN